MGDPLSGDEAEAGNHEAGAGWSRAEQPADAETMNDNDSPVMQAALDAVARMILKTDGKGKTVEVIAGLAGSRFITFGGHRVPAVPQVQLTPFRS
jgi:hypothetical protein